MDMIIISGKNLGALAVSDFCPRCFWLKLHCDNKLPFQIFPGIFSSIDSYTKKITNLHYNKRGSLPEWLLAFEGLDKPVKAPHFTKFFVIDPETNVHLRGVPDEIVRKKDGSFMILDYKTAKYTGNQDKLLPMYEVQLNSYAYIGNRGAFNPVSAIGLVYYEPVTDVGVEDIDSLVIKNGFQMAFSSNLHKLNLDPDAMIPPLLKKVREIYDSPSIPKGLESCKDCSSLNTLMQLVQ
jgi:hypothetical protein